VVPLSKAKNLVGRTNGYNYDKCIAGRGYTSRYDV